MSAATICTDTVQLSRTASDGSFSASIDSGDFWFALTVAPAADNGDVLLVRVEHETDGGFYPIKHYKGRLGAIVRTRGKFVPMVYRADGGVLAEGPGGTRAQALSALLTLAGEVGYRGAGWAPERRGVVAWDESLLY